MYQTGYHSTGYYATGYYVPDAVIIETPTGGGGGTSFPGYNVPSPRPSIDKHEPLYLAQALQEDEEMIILLKALAEVVTWH